MKKAAFVVLMILLSVHCLGQGTYKPVSQDPPSTTKVEKVEGVLAVTGYFGNKLLDELKSRFNLAEEQQKTEPTKVIVKVGGISFERIEQRPVKDS